MAIAEPFGWKQEIVSYTLKQGERGARRVAMTVKKPDNTPLDSYDGWSAQLALARTTSRRTEIQIAPAVIADGEGNRLIVDLRFTTELTRAVGPGKFVGDLVMIDPDGQRHYPLDFTLTLNRSTAPVSV